MSRKPRVLVAVLVHKKSLTVEFHLHPEPFLHQSWDLGYPFILFTGFSQHGLEDLPERDALFCRLVVQISANIEYMLQIGMHIVFFKCLVMICVHDSSHTRADFEIFQDNSNEPFEFARGHI